MFTYSNQTRTFFAQAAHPRRLNLVHHLDHNHLKGMVFSMLGDEEGKNPMVDRNVDKQRFDSFHTLTAETFQTNMHYESLTKN